MKITRFKMFFFVWCMIRIISIIPIDCYTDLDCGITTICKGVSCSWNKGCSGTCQSGCRNDSNCTLDTICINSKCTTGCRNDNNCEKFQKCNNNKKCEGRKCSSKNKCQKGESGSYCDNGVCKVGCRNNNDCPSDFYCVNSSYCQRHRVQPK